jgi:hypothetical protein
MKIRRSKLLALPVTAFLALAACSSGPSAPPLGTPETVCNADFCIDVPQGWTVELGDGYVSAHHEVAPDETFLTAGLINFEAIVESAGSTWPVPTSEVSRSFWTLLEQANVGDFERSQRMVGGAERSWGTHEDGQMWHLVYPTESSRGIGVELRAPNDTWEAHADTVFASVTPLR